MIITSEIPKKSFIKYYNKNTKFSKESKNGKSFKIINGL